MAGAMTQVNVRMSTALKAAGDRAFQSAGLSPSEVVRAAYARAVELSHSLRGVSDIITSDARSEDEREERRRQIESFDRSAHACEDIAARFGLRVDAQGFAPMTDDEVEDAFYQDFLAGEAR